MKLNPQATEGVELEAALSSSSSLSRQPVDSDLTRWLYSVTSLMKEHTMPNAVAYLDESTASVWERTHGERPGAYVHILR